jgi:uncharacterized protein with HEPN domain
MSPETRDISILEPIIAAHHYGEFSADFLWDTVTDDIDELRDYCKACIAELLSGFIGDQD